MSTSDVCPTTLQQKKTAFMISGYKTSTNVFMATYCKKLSNTLLTFLGLAYPNNSTLVMPIIYTVEVTVLQPQLSDGPISSLPFDK